MQNFATVLTPEQIIRVHQASLDILEKVGMLVRNAQARQILARNGCAVDEATQIVRFPRDLVRRALQTVPRYFRLGARDPAFDLQLQDGVTYFTTDGCGV
ncbi:MAG: trimethylamine methyltransferase family protein, partial [Chloroflexi bacterium]|nr:trimethylamine methyltransferase family protein [Chloroflexota bacterium]